MKKLTSYFIGILMLFLNLNLCFAGGDDKILILSDGTKLTYVSSGNIHGVLQKIKELHEFYTNKKFSKNQNIAIKTVASSIGILDTMLTPILAYNACTGDNIKSDHPYLLTGAFIVGGIAILGSSMLGWTYPDKINKKVYKKESGYCTIYNSLRKYNFLNNYFDEKYGLKVNQLEELCQRIRNNEPCLPPWYILRSSREMIAYCTDENMEREFKYFCNQIDNYRATPYRCHGSIQGLGDHESQMNPSAGVIIVEQANGLTFVYSQQPVIRPFKLKKNDKLCTIKDEILYEKNLQVVRTIYPEI